MITNRDNDEMNILRRTFMCAAYFLLMFGEPLVNICVIRDKFVQTISPIHIPFLFLFLHFQS